MTQAEKAATVQFRRIRALIEKGATFDYASTPVHTDLSFLSRKRGDLRKYFMGLGILRAPLPPGQPEEGTLWPVYAGDPERSELDDTFVLVYSKGEWLGLGNTPGKHRDWRPIRSS